MHDEIVFGEKNPDIDYQRRVGAYMVIPDETETQILIVSPPNQTFLLPGGGIESGETDVATITRELVEETGGVVDFSRYLGTASEYFYSTFRQQGFYHPAHFYAGKNYRKTQAPLEGDFNRILWLPIEEALTKLKRPTHRWALEQWVKRPQAEYD
ncbi:NUDIX hydrolase [Loigolactobacillus bifermentans]|jgi:8-oxo-dGTP diphosphatase|uniref:MutT nudix family protein n=1 Tax=Loigolactobacillus bifermentans DSM 20003 TaxID=1423726 RepID=A0A0R1H6X8_9LACO|nr:NUDIX domain-containing protein [Loigolactobacillus bifermentans]KRK39242.1 MutT nudix family protein [Loigolactobacillus bifermentans DSM 20003]QGG61449.1 NUDIX domain-containing protein [Loigolactobacillus bifermentans]